MADIELIIKIPEEQYNIIKSDLYNTFTAEMKKWGLAAIRNGTPIPDNATNGDVFGKIMDYMFMDDAYITTDKNGYLHLRGVKEDWWNAPYQKGGKE